MLILTQDRLHLVNTETARLIGRRNMYGDIIYYALYNEDETILGTYKNTPEHENQIERIAEVYGAINCYVMPKEEI